MKAFVIKSVLLLAFNLKNKTLMVCATLEALHCNVFAIAFPERPDARNSNTWHSRGVKPSAIKLPTL